jgi:hypothetical protein
LRLKFKNGLNVALSDWTQSIKLYNVESIKRRIESRSKGEAGVVVFDKLSLTLNYEAGDNPVYNAFSGDLSDVQRYIFEIHGTKSDKTDSKLFEGIADLSTIEWPDLENKISFNIVDKLSALSLIKSEFGRDENTLDPDANTFVIYPEDNQTFLITKWVNGSAVEFDNVSQDLVKGAVLSSKAFDQNDPKLYLITKTAWSTRNYPSKESIPTSDGTDPVLECKIYSFDDMNPAEYDPHYYYYGSKYYGENITYSEDGIAVGFDAVIILHSMLSRAWGNITLVNKSGYSNYPINLSYFQKLIDEKPFGYAPIDAVKMLAASMQCYIYFNKAGALVLQKKDRIQYNTLRTIDSFSIKNGGKRKYFWDKLVDAVTVNIESGKTLDGVSLTGTSTVNIENGTEPRNALNVNVIAPYSLSLTQATLDSCAQAAAVDILEFYGKRHYYYNLNARLTDEMYDWELLDLLSINNITYFIISSEINEIDKTANFELVSLNGYVYNYQQARPILSKEKFNSTASNSSSQSGSSVQTGSYIFTQPLEAAGNFITLNYSDNLTLNDDNKLDAIQDIKTTSTVFRIERTGIGGAADTSYKLKNYGDSWLVGNVKIDGAASIGGAADPNFKLKTYGDQKITGNLTVDGNFYIGGSINEVNVNELNVSDSIIKLNKGGDSYTAANGGIQLLGTDDTVIGSIIYNGSAWQSSLDFNLPSGKTYKINSTEVLNSTTLGSSIIYSSLTTIGTLNQDLNLSTGYVIKINSIEVLSANTLGVNIVNSSLTKVGTLTTGVWNAAAINGNYINYSTTNFKVSSNQLNTIQDIALSSSPTFAGLTAINGNSYMQSIYPLLTDTYDLGSFTKMWSNAYISQIQAVVFAENTISAIGGYMMISKGQGTLPAIAAGTNQIDFGQTMNVGDFVLVKAKAADGNYKTEYITVGSLVSGTTYNVTRDAANAHSTDPAWTDGTVYLILGQNNNGRLELNAYDTPRLSVIKQGSSYNSQTELIRLGDLNGFLGYAAETYGIAIGESTKYLKYDTMNGLRIAGSITISDGSAGGWTIDAGKIYSTYAYLSGSGYISFGNTPPTSYGNNVGAWLGYSSGAKLSLYSDSSNYLQWNGSSLTIKGGSINGSSIILDFDSYNRLSIDSSNGIKFPGGLNLASTAGQFFKNYISLSAQATDGKSYTNSIILDGGQFGANASVSINGTFSISSQFLINISGQITKINSISASASSRYAVMSDGTSYTPRLITAADIDPNVSNTEFSYLDGVSSAIQTQLNAKAASSHTHASSDITSGQISDTYIASAAAWNAKASTGANTFTGVQNFTNAIRLNSIGTVSISSNQSVSISGKNIVRLNPAANGYSVTLPSGETEQLTMIINISSTFSITVESNTLQPGKTMMVWWDNTSGTFQKFISA